MVECVSLGKKGIRMVECVGLGKKRIGQENLPERREVKWT